MHESNVTPFQPLSPRAAPTTGPEPDLRSLSVRELISELALTEAVLHHTPDWSTRSTTLQRQARIVGELRRRQGPGRPRSRPRPVRRLTGGAPPPGQ